MAQSNSLKIKFDAQRSLAFGSIVAGYTGVGTYLAYPARMIIIQNLTDTPVQFSFDGITDHLPLPANGQVVLDLASNKTQEQGLYLDAGSRLYVKRLVGVPSSGSVYFSVIYGV